MIHSMDDDAEDELREINQTALDVLETVHAVTDRLPSAANARAMLLGVAAVMIAANMRDGEEPDAGEINRIWAERGFPWRMVKSLQ